MILGCCERLRSDSALAPDQSDELKLLESAGAKVVTQFEFSFDELKKNAELRDRVSQLFE